MDISQHALRQQVQDGRGQLRALSVQARGLQTARGVDGARDHVGGEHMGAVGIGVAQEVRKGYGGEGVVVGIGGFVEFNHYE